MALARGKYGIEYNPRRVGNDSSGLGWLFALVGAVAFVSFCWSVYRNWRSSAEDDEPKPLPQAEAAVATIPMESMPTAKPSDRITIDYTRGSARLRNLLMRLDEAEKSRDVEMAISTIETIRQQGEPLAKSLDDRLVRRLGELNLYRLMTLHSAQWVRTVEARRGDSASRIAYENGSTLKSMVRLNGGSGEDLKFRAGQKMLVMNHPRFRLVFTVGNQVADLWLNGKFFRRYVQTVPTSGNVGEYSMPGRRIAFWRGLGAHFEPVDRDELDMLLPTGAVIEVKAR